MAHIRLRLKVMLMAKNNFYFGNWNYTNCRSVGATILQSTNAATITLPATVSVEYTFI